MDGRPQLGCGLLAHLRDCRSNDPSRSLLKRHAATGKFPLPSSAGGAACPRATTKSYSRESSLASPVNSTPAQEGRDLALLEAAEGQVRGVLDGVHAVSGGDGARDGAQCNAGVGLGKAGVFVALVIEEARERIEPGRRHADIAPQAIVGDGLRKIGGLRRVLCYA